MKKIISLLLAVMLIAFAAVLPAGAESTAKITIVALDGKSMTRTYNVGDTIEVHTLMDTSSIQDGKIASIMGQQLYNKDVLELVAELDDEGLVENLEEMFPVTKKKTIANAAEKGAVYFSASEPSTQKPFIFTEGAQLIVTKFKVKAAGEATVETSLTTLAGADFYLTKIINKGQYTDPSYSIEMSSVYPGVSGSVKSASKDDVVTITIEGKNNNLKETTTGTSEFCFDTIPAGTYKLTVSGDAKYITREYEVAVDDFYAVQDVTLCPLGDVNGDGKTTQTDYVTAMSYVRKTKDLNDYQIKCGDVFGKGDGKLTAQDANRIVQHTRKVKALY